MIANQNTNNQLGGEEDVKTLKFLLENVIMPTKIGRYWYQYFGPNLLSKDLHEIADDIFEKHQN